MIDTANIQIKRPLNEATKSHSRVVIPNIIDTTLRSHNRHVKYGYLKEFSSNFPNSVSGMKKLYDFIRSNIKYKKDKALREVIQSPGFLWHTTRAGDCKSMAAFVGEVLHHKGIPFKYRFVSDQPSGKINHVYIAARVGGKVITIDPTISNFNKEMRVTKKMDLSPGVYSIAGYNKGNYPGKLSKKPYIDYTSMTSGEMYTALMYEQLKMLGDFYGDKEVIKDADLVRNVLRSGLHQSSTFGSISGISSDVGKKLISVKNRQNPATSLISLKDRTNVGIGNIAPIDDCFLTWRKYEEESGIRNTLSESKRRKMRDNSPLFKNCIKANEYKKIFNQHLEGAAYQVLYNFNPSPNESPAIVAAKTVLQKNAIGSLSGLSGIDTVNFNMWIRNGIIRSNVAQGLEPLQPEQSYDTLYKNGSESIEGLATIAAAAAAIYKAVVAAVRAIKKIINSMSKEDKISFETQAQGVGQNSFGPQPGDFQGIVSDLPASEEDNSMLIAAAALIGGALLIK